MATCPRCGAPNKPGRPSCWNCWSPLTGSDATDATPSSPPTARTPADPHGATVGESVVMPEMLRHPDGEVPADDPQPRRAAVPRASTPPPEHGFAYVAEPTVRAEASGAGWLVTVSVLLILMLLSAMLIWYFTFRPRPRAVNAGEVAQSYLTAMAVGDGATQQQLATEESKGLLVPSWIIIMGGRVTDELAEQGTSATVDAELQLAPGTYSGAPNPKLEVALSHAYRVAIPLVREGGVWRVDQRALLKNLRAKLAVENPDVNFPSWD